MPRLLVVILLLMAALWLLHRLSTMPRARLVRRLRQAAIWGLIGVLVFAVLTGRLSPLFALIGAAIPVLLRLLALLRLVPELHQILRSLGLSAGAGAANGETGPGLPPDSGPMSEAEARAILGVDAKADAEAIRAAHRRLMQRLHPDRGGSDYLAARINAAKRRLLGE